MRYLLLLLLFPILCLGQGIRIEEGYLRDYPGFQFGGRIVDASLCENPIDVEIKYHEQNAKEKLLQNRGYAGFCTLEMPGVDYSCYYQYSGVSVQQMRFPPPPPQYYVVAFVAEKHLYRFTYTYYPPRNQEVDGRPMLDFPEENSIPSSPYAARLESASTKGKDALQDEFLCKVAMKFLNYDQQLAKLDRIKMTSLFVRVNGDKEVPVDLSKGTINARRGDLVTFRFGVNARRYLAYNNRIEEHKPSHTFPCKIQMDCDGNKRKVFADLTPSGIAQLHWGRITSLQVKTFRCRNDFSGKIFHRFGREKETWLDGTPISIPFISPVGSSKQEWIDALAHNIYKMYDSDYGFLRANARSHYSLSITPKMAWALSRLDDRYEILRQLAKKPQNMYQYTPYSLIYRYFSGTNCSTKQLVPAIKDARSSYPRLVPGVWRERDAAVLFDLVTLADHFRQSSFTQKVELFAEELAAKIIENPNPSQVEFSKAVLIHPEKTSLAHSYLVSAFSRLYSITGKFKYKKIAREQIKRAAQFHDNGSSWTYQEKVELALAYYQLSKIDNDRRYIIKYQKRFAGLVEYIREQKDKVSTEELIYALYFFHSIE